MRKHLYKETNKQSLKGEKNHRAIKTITSDFRNIKYSVIQEQKCSVMSSEDLTKMVPVSHNILDEVTSKRGAVRTADPKTYRSRI